MPILEMAAKFGIYAVMATVLIFALGVVTFRNLFHCALCLAAALIGTAAIYIALQAEFLAGVQILLYVGAVITLIIFAIMLTEHLAGKTIRQTNSQSPLAIVGLLGFVACSRLDPQNTLAGHRNRTESQGLGHGSRQGPDGDLCVPVRGHFDRAYRGIDRHGGHRQEG
jgi:NADH:ubiquinone oxidoreductase subunit 6 (subunit J)